MKPAVSATLVASTAIALLVAAPLAANAHVGVSPSSTAAGGASVLTFSFNHGCSGSPTTALTFDIPDAVVSATPTVEAGWTIARTDSTITYTAIDPVPDGQRATIELAVTLPDGELGEIVAFPVMQTCEVGETAWVELAGEGEAEPEHPAPAIALSEARDDGHHGAATSGSDDHAGADDHATADTVVAVDPLGRGLGIAGIVVGAAGIIIAIAARRKGVTA